MVKLKVPLYIDSRMVPAGEEIALPEQLEALLLKAGNAELAVLSPLPAAPGLPFVPESSSVDEPAPVPAEEIPLEPEKPTRRYGR